MNAICITSHLKDRRGAQNSYAVGSVKHLRLEQDLESFWHFANVPAHSIVVMLRVVGQVIQTIIHGGLEICVTDGMTVNNSWELLWLSRRRLLDHLLLQRLLRPEDLSDSVSLYAKYRGGDFDFYPRERRKDLWRRRPPLRRSRILFPNDDFDESWWFDQERAGENSVGIIAIVI